MPIKNFLKNCWAFLKRNRAIVGILCLGLILRLIYFAVILRNFGSSGFYLSSNGDAVEYLTLAQQWLATHTFQSLSNVYESLMGANIPEVYRMPGYPLFIAFFYKMIPTVVLPILAQNLIFLSCIALFYKFILDIFENKRTALTASALLSWEPSAIYWNNQLITETLFAALLFLSVYSIFAFYRLKNAYYSALAGLLLALAIFIRPAGEYLVLIFVVFYGLLLLSKIINWRKFICSVFLLIFSFIFVLSPWLIQNKIFFGRFGISNSSVNGFGKYVTAINKLKLGKANARTGSHNPMERAAIIRGRAADAILKYPLFFVKIYSLSLVPFFFGDSYVSVFGRIFPDLEKQRVITDWTGTAKEFFGFMRGHRGAEAAVFFLGKAVWAAIILFALAGLIHWIFRYKKNYSTLAFLLLMIFYFSLASGIGSYSRFRFPVNPYIFIFAALGIERLINYISIKGGKT